MITPISARRAFARLLLFAVIATAAVAATKGLLTSTRDAPFSEIPADRDDPRAGKARTRLQTLFDRLQ